MPRGKTEKSERTRAAIEQAARRLFTEQGYDRTTVRDIAAEAGADPALVVRYFGSKEALFSAVAEPDLGLPDLKNVPRGQVGETLVRHFLQLWGGGSGLPVLLRSAASNDAAAEQLKSVFSRQVAPLIAANGDPATARERAGLVSSQLLGLALTRYILKLPPVVGMEDEFIVREVGKTVQRYISLPAEVSEKQHPRGLGASA